MVTFEEFANLVNLIKHNQQMPAEDIVHEYQDWSSSEGETFTKVDEDRHMFEVNREFQLRYLGQGLRGFGAFQHDPTWGKLFDDIERQRDSPLE